MYEAVVLQKKGPKVSKTPFAKLNLFYKFTLVLIPTSFCWILLNYIDSKKRLLKELDEFNIDNEKLSLGDQYFLLQKFWKNPYLRGATSIALERYKEEGRLTSTNEFTFKDFKEQIKDTPVI